MVELFGYLDPGSGSVILQAIIGGALGILVVFKSFWHRIKAFFSKKNSEAGQD